MIKQCSKCKLEIQRDGDTTFDVFHTDDFHHEVVTYSRSNF